MANYTSKKFATPQEFEEWIAKNQELTDNAQVFPALKKVTLDKEDEWDSKFCDVEVTADGKMQFKCVNGVVRGEVNICHADGSTLTRDETGALIVQGIKDQNSGEVFSVWFGTEEQFNNTTKTSGKMLYIYTTDFEADVLAALATLRQADTTEATARASADTALQQNIDNEATTRASAVTAEATARANADTTLQTNIDSEATERKNAVAAIRSELASGDLQARNAVYATRATETAFTSTNWASVEAGASGYILAANGTFQIATQYQSFVCTGIITRGLYNSESIIIGTIPLNSTSSSGSVRKFYSVFADITNGNVKVYAGLHVENGSFDGTPTELPFKIRQIK